jgi:hypothetical protein
VLYLGTAHLASEGQPSAPNNKRVPAP